MRKISLIATIRYDPGMVWSSTLQRLVNLFPVLINSTSGLQVRNMVLGRDRRPELGYKLALEFRSNFTYPAKNKNSKYNNTVNSEQEGSMANVNESNHNSVKVDNINNACFTV